MCISPIFQSHTITGCIVHYLDEVADKKGFSEYILSEERIKVLFLAQQLDRRGDVTNALAIATMMREVFPSVEFSFSTFSGELRSEQQAIVKKAYVPLDEILGADAKKAISFETAVQNINSYSRIYIYPMLSDTFIPAEVLKAGVPITGIRECGDTQFYSNESRSIYTLGFNRERGEVGVMLSAELRRYAELHKKDSSEERLLNLKNIPKYLQIAILGKPWATKVIKKFVNASKLYFGYGYLDDIKGCFLKAIATLKGEHNIVCCFPNLDIEKLAQFFTYDFAKKPMAERGFREITVHKVNAQGTGIDKIGTIALSDHKQKGKRTFNVIVCPLSQTESFELRKSSELEELDTGDGTFLEGLMLGKHVLYDLRDYKIGMINAFISIAAKYNSRLSDILKLSIFGHKGEHAFGQTRKLDAIVRGADLLFMALSTDPNLKLAWEATLSEVFKEYNLASHVKSMLIQDFANFVPAENPDELVLYAAQDPAKYAPELIPRSMAKQLSELKGIYQGASAASPAEMSRKMLNLLLNISL